MGFLEVFKNEEIGSILSSDSIGRAKPIVSDIVGVEAIEDIVAAAESRDYILAYAYFSKAIEKIREEVFKEDFFRIQDFESEALRIDFYNGEGRVQIGFDSFDDVRVPMYYHSPTRRFTAGNLEDFKWKKEDSKAEFSDRALTSASEVVRTLVVCIMDLAIRVEEIFDKLNLEVVSEVWSSGISIENTSDYFDGFCMLKFYIETRRNSIYCSSNEDWLKMLREGGSIVKGFFGLIEEDGPSEGMLPYLPELTGGRYFSGIWPDPSVTQDDIGIDRIRKRKSALSGTSPIRIVGNLWVYPCFTNGQIGRVHSVSLTDYKLEILDEIESLTHLSERDRADLISGIV